jgi:two-component system, NtrC family, nitrogen regulation sensor histidine kinase NtrY
MRVNFGLRTIVISLFLVLFISSLIVLNAFFNLQQKQIKERFQYFQIDDKISELTFYTEEDSLLAQQMVGDIRESLMAIEMISAETQIYSSLFLFLIMIVSVAVFILVLYAITKPLKELQTATAKIRSGDFSVYLPTKGIKEMKELKQSFNDMSNELEHTHTKLLLAEKEMIWKELSRMLAHEIKNPLTPIQLSIQRLEERFDHNDESFKSIFPEAIRIIHQEIGNLRDLVQSFSNFAKISQPDLTTFDPALEIRNTVEPYLHKYNFSLDLTEKCQISFDLTHFYQIVTNIVQNAVDASTPDAPISISLKCSNNFIVIQFIDKGKGIQENDLPKIFDPYFSRKQKGTGMGLAVVKKLCDANGAHLRVKSKVNLGTQFELIIEEKK